MVSEDTRARIRAYLLEQAATKTFGELRPAVEEARAALLKEADGVSEAQARFRPAGDGEQAWSVLQTLRHVAFEEEDVGRQIAALAGGTRTEGTVIGRPGGRESASLGELVHDLGNIRAGFLSGIDALDGQADVAVTAPHPFFGELNARAWFIFQRIHDLDHVRQIAKIKADPLYPRA